MNDDEEVDQLLEASPSDTSLSEVEERDRFDDRVSLVNAAFANLVGVTPTKAEFCSISAPPPLSEQIAWIWLFHPRLSGALLRRIKHAHFEELVRTYDSGEWG